MALWSEMMCAPERDLRIGGRIVFASGQECPLTGEMILSLAIDEGADGAIVPGSVLCASCAMDLANDEGQWLPGGRYLGGNDLAGATLLPELGAADGEEILWRSLGVFQVESAVCLEREGCVRVKAADSIAFELDGPFADGLEYPQLLEGLWRHAVGQTRYSFSGAFPGGDAVVDLPPDWKNASLRTAIGYIAAAAGCFVQLDRQGGLQLRPLWDGNAAPAAIGTDSYLKLEADDISYGGIDALRVVFAGDGTEQVFCADEAAGALWTLTISGNPLFQKDAPNLSSLAKSVLAGAAGFESEGLRFDWRGDPELRVGDRVEITDRLGRVRGGVLSRQSLRFSLGFSASCACAAPDVGSSGMRRAVTPEGGLNAAALTGAVNGALLSVGSVTANKLAAGSVTAEKLAAGAVDAGALEAVIAKIASLTAEDISADRMAAALAAFTVIAAGTAEFDFATVSHLVSQALQLEKGVGEEMFIRNLAVSYAQMAEAQIGQLCIRAGDGSYYVLDVSPEGMVVAEKVEPGDAEISAGQTEDGRVILETQIAADALSAGELSAVYALINRIDAARIDVDELFARQAFISRLVTGKIVGEKSITLIAGQAEAAATREELAHLVRIQSDGVHVGALDSSGEVVIDSDSVDIQLGGRKFSSFGGSYVEFGNYQLRRTADGGLAFKMREDTL